MIQDHLHLGVTLGSAPENAPLYKWRAKEYTPTPRIIMEYDFTLMGNLREYVVRDTLGDPIQWKDVTYRLIIEAEDSYSYAEREAQIFAMQGRIVQLVEHDHVADGADHSAYVREMFCESVGEFEWLSQSLQRAYVTVSLIDAHRR